MKFIPRSIVALVAFLALGGFACTPAATPTSVTVATLRTGVVVAADAWNVAATACNNLAEANGGDAGVAIESTCSTYLVPAHDLIVDAANYVDSDAAASPQAVCNLVSAVNLIAQAGQDPALKLSAGDVLVLQDASAIANALLGSAICAADAGH